MTSFSSSSPSRPGLLRELSWRLDTRAGLVAMFSVGLLVRIFIAPHAGFYGDLKWFQTWATRLAEVGPGRFYAHGRFADYLSPPHFLVSPAGASPAAGANSPAACVVSGSRS